jgi:hypothetical protein
MLDQIRDKVCRAGAGRGEGKLIKTSNLEPFPDEEIVKIARFGANGERSDATSGVRTWFWPRRILREFPMEMSPVSQLIGIPLCAAKVEPLIVFTDRADFDNQWATYLMIDPASGFAPDKWQAFVGPVVVWRPSWEPFSEDDAFLIYDFLCTLLEKYSCGCVRWRRDITPTVFQQSKARSLNFEGLNAEDIIGGHQCLRARPCSI